MGWFSNAVKWVSKKVVTPVVSTIVNVVDTVGDFVDGALEAGGNFIEALANTKFKSSGTLDGSGGNDLLVGIEFKSVGKFLELSFKALFSRDFWTTGQLPASVRDYAGDNNSALTINGQGGNDTIFTFGGSVTQNGGSGHDSMLALGGVTVLNGGSGNDFIVGASLVRNTIDGGADRDTIIALGAINTVAGGSGDDIITVFGAKNQVDAGSGADFVAALALGGNQLWGRQNNDILVALGGANSIRGGEDRDFIAAAGGANFLYGGGDKDTIVAIGGGNWIYGDADNGDFLGSGAGSNDGDAGADVIVAFGIGNFIWAEGGNDVVTAFGGAATVDGGSGNDVIVAVGGGNFLFGGQGDDIVVGVGQIANLILGEDGDDIVVSFSALDLSYGGAGDDILIAAGPAFIGFQMGGEGQDVLVALGGAVRIQFGDNPFTYEGDDDAQRDGIIGFALDTFNGFEFTDFEFEDLSLPTLPTLDDFDSNVIGAMEGFVDGALIGLGALWERLEQIPDLFNGSTLSFDRLNTAFTAIELPGFSRPDFGTLSKGVLSPFSLSGISLDNLEGLSAPGTPDFSLFDLETERFDDIDVLADGALSAQQIFTPSTSLGGIDLPDFDSMLPNLSTGFDSGVISTLNGYLPGQSLDTSGLPNLGFAGALNIGGISLPNAGGLLNSVASLALPSVETLDSLGATLTGIFDFSRGSGLVQPGEGRGDFNLPSLSFPQLSIPDFDLFDPVPGDNSDILASLAGVSLLFGQEDDDIIIGGGFANLLFGGEGADIIAGIAKGNLISGGADDDIVMALGLVNLVSGGAGSDILAAAGKANIVAGGTDGDILVAGGLANLMLGGSGRDLIGGAGKLNIIAAGADNDVVLGGGKFNLALGGAGADLMIGGGTVNAMLGGAGNDFIAGGGKFNTGFGGEGNDILLGGGKFNVLDGDIGDDLMIGGGTFNVLYARSGNDALLGGGKFNTFIGGQGTDLLLGGGKFNTFMSGTEADSDEEDHDILLAAGKYNTFFAGGGDDLAFVGGSLNHVFMGSGQDIVISYAQGLNMIFGQAGADLIFGAGNGNVYTGGTGNDLLFGFGIDEEEETNDDGSTPPDLDVKSDGSVALYGDWGNDLLIGVGNNLDMYGGAGQDKLLAGGGINYLRGEDGYDSLISLFGLSALDGGDGNDIIYSKGTVGNIGLPSSAQLLFDGGDVQGGKGSDLIWANGDDIEVFGDAGVSIFSPEEALDGETRDSQDGDDYMIVSGANSEAYGQAGDDVMLFYGVNHRGLGGAGDDLMLAFGSDTTLLGGAGDDEIINMGGKIARAQGDAGNDTVLGKGYALLDWMAAKAGALVSEFTQNLTLVIENIAELIGNTVSSVGSFREFNGDQITANAIYLGRDGLGVAPEAETPTAEEIATSEAEATSSHIFALIDTFGETSLGSYLSEVANGNAAAFAPSYDTLAGDVTQAATSVASPLAGGVVALNYLQDMPVSAFVLAAPLAPVFQGGSDDDILGGRLGLSSLFGGAGNDTYLKSVAERVTIIDEEGHGGDDTLKINARLTDVAAFGLNGIALTNLLFQRIDARADTTADDLLISVLDDSGDVKSITVLLDQYQAASAIETLRFTDWLGNEIVLDLGTVMPTQITANATVDGNALSALVGEDEALLENELRSYAAYNEMFLFSDFDLEDQAVTATGETLNSLETALDAYFRSLGDSPADGATTVATATSLEDALDGEAFDGAPVLEVQSGTIQEFFDDGALLKIRRFDDSTGAARYDSRLSANGPVTGLRDLHVLADGTAIFRAAPRADLEIGLTGPDTLLSSTAITALNTAQGFSPTSPLPAGDLGYGALKIAATTGTDLALPVEVSGAGAGAGEVLMLSAADLDGLSVAVSDVYAVQLDGEVTVDLRNVTNTFSSADNDTRGQTVRMLEGLSRVYLFEGDNTIEVLGGGGDFRTGSGRDNFLIDIGAIDTSFNSRFDGGTRTSDTYKLMTSGPGATLGGTILINTSVNDRIDLTGLSDDVYFVPLSTGMRLQNDTGYIDIRFQNIQFQPIVRWTDGEFRRMIDYYQSVQITDYAEFIHVRQIGGDTTERFVEGKGGDDVIISSKPFVRIDPGLGDDYVELYQSPVVGTPTIVWTGGNDHYYSKYQLQQLRVELSLGVSTDYKMVAGLDEILLTYQPTGEVIRIEAPESQLVFSDITYLTTALPGQMPNLDVVTDEDVPVDLDAEANSVPVGAQTVALRIFAANGQFETATGDVLADGDTITPEAYLSIRYVPDDDFNTATGAKPRLEAEFLDATGLILGSQRSEITVNSVIDEAVFGFEGHAGVTDLVLQEGDASLAALGFTFRDPDAETAGKTVSVEFVDLSGNGTLSNLFTATGPAAIGLDIDNMVFVLGAQEAGEYLFNFLSDTGAVEGSLRLTVEAVDDPEYFVGVPATPIELAENRSGPFLESVSIGSVDDETGQYVVEFGYLNAANAVTEGFAGWVVSNEGSTHPDGAFVGNEIYDLENGTGIKRLTGTIDQINSAIDEMQAWGGRNYEGVGDITMDLYKVGTDGSEILQDSAVIQIDRIKGVNRIETERYNDVIMTQDEGTVEIGIGRPFDEDFALDAQPVFPVIFQRVPEYGVLSLADGTPVQAGITYTDDDLVSLTYTPDPDVLDPFRDFAYDDFARYYVQNPAGSTIFTYSFISFFVYDDRITEEVDDGAGGTITRPVGYQFFDFESRFRGTINSEFYGGEGDDTFTPRGGIDMMLGRGGSDTFIIDEDAGKFNVIGDFELGIDRLEFGQLNVVSIDEAFYFDDPDAGETDTTLDTVVSLSNGSILVLEDVTNFLAAQNVAPSGPDVTFEVAAYSGFEAQPELTGNVLSGLTDANGDPITVDLASLVHIWGARFGNLSLQADGSFTYRPNLYAVGQDRFSFIPTDGEDAGRRVTVTINLERPDNLGTDDPDVLNAAATGEGLAGGAGADTLNGGAGDDTLAGGFGPDALNLGAGADMVRGTLTELDGDVITGFGEDDVILVQDSDFLDLQINVAGNDIILGLGDGRKITLRDLPSDLTFVQSPVAGGVEIRLLDEAPGTSVLSTAADRLASTSDDALAIFADAGDDAVAGGSANDLLVGGAGDDVLIGGDGDDTVDGGAGKNVLIGGAGQDVFVLDLNGLSFGAHYTVIRDFTPGEDIIEISRPGFGSFDDLALVDNLRGATVFQNLPFVALDGVTPGQLSEADFRFTQTGLRRDLESTTSLSVLTQADETFVIDRGAGGEVRALGGNDVVLGAAGDDTLLGGEGDDRLLGRDGADLLDGGAGVNLLTGGEGPDTFRLSDLGGAVSRDIITDFVLGVDRIILDRLPGISSLEDIARSDTPEGLEFDLGGGRTLVIAGLTAAEEFDSTDIDVIAGPAGPVTSTASAELGSSPTAASGAGDAIQMRAWTVSIGAFEANLALGVGYSDNMQVDGPILITVANTGGDITAATIGDTRITINGDDQGPVTALSVETIAWIDTAGVTHSVAVAVISRAVTADYLLVPIDVAAGKLSGITLPAETAITRVTGPDALEGTLSLLPQALEVGTSRSAEIETAGAFDVLTVELTAGVAYEMTMSATSVALDPDLRLLGPDGTLLRGTLSADGTTARLSVTPAVSGAFFVYVADDGDTDIGGYRLLVTSATDDLLTGDETPNALAGGNGNDRILGFAAADELSGGAGHDTLNGGDGDDRLQGGDGDDYAIGGLNDDDIFGGAGDDLIEGNNGNDLMQGDAGNDTLRAGNGDDSIEGGAGDDIAFGGNDDDHLQGGDGNDTLDGSGGNDTILGQAGDDLLVGETGADDMQGGTGNDTLRGGGGDDAIHGDEGHDLIFGGSGADVMRGGIGNDTLDGNTQADELYGGDGDDILRGGDGFDFLEGGAGDDVLAGGNGIDILIGGLGQDILRGDAQNDIFVFNTVAESSFTAFDVIDGIDGIGATGGDVIDLAAIDADASTAGDDGFTFLGHVSTAVALGFGAGALWVEDAGPQTRLYGLVDDDGTIDFALRINDGATISAADYLATDFFL